ncbi:MAG TPA: 4'-phosphopantetheinyl transferase superfamily protein [Steroidobacter sp.]|uniref:4'-phosphopantetheinyl transferase family protein n=1 Tax=Steroidobacter sp. TaxID=1978227 RepID=UPI002ED79B34
MHGNPHAHADTRVGLNSGLAEGDLALWLGLPAAREHFDPSTLSAADRSRLSARRRRADFEVSRALLALVDAGSTPHSLSHSAEHAALLVAPAGWQVGVDLEINRPRDVLRLACFAFHEREVLAMEAASPEARPQLFYTLWTLKEAVAKALHLDLIDALRQCVFWKEDGEWQGRVPTISAWGAAVFQPRPDIFLAAVWIGGSEPARVQQWEWPPKQRADWPVIACASSPASADAAPA